MKINNLNELNTPCLILDKNFQKKIVVKLEKDVMNLKQY